MAPGPKRFIKKVPASGGPPAFKLTLPHQIVSNHLQHLVDAEFELAPRANAQQTWQGSIAPRRNKERSEYTLQGWKLFAEAHKVKAGDQVSFELVSPYRMVIQIIRPMDPMDITTSTQDIHQAPSYPDVPSPVSKSIKLNERSSPGSSGGHNADAQIFLGSYSDQDLWPIPLDGPADLDDWPALPAQISGGSEEGSSEMMESARQIETAQQDQPGAQLLSPNDSRFLLPQSPTDSSRMGAPHHGAAGMPAVPDSATPRAQGCKRSQSPNGTLLRTTGSASTLFTDMMRGCPLHRANPEPATPQPIAKEYFDLEDSDTSNVPAAPRPESAPHLNLQLGSLTATVQSLQTDVQQFETRASCAEREVDSLRVLYEKLQGALDRRTREALRAETGLEKTTSRLSMPQLLAAVDGQTADTLLAIQSDLFNCLTALKHSLWELLVLTLGENPEGGASGGRV